MAEVSIIIPTMNRAAALAGTLESVAKVVDPCSSVEIIVVDNGSTDKSAEAFLAAKNKYPDREWRYFYEPMPGLLSGRHRGAAEAAGEILAFLDDDVVLSSTWLGALDEAFETPDVALVGGPSLPRYENAPPAWLNGLWVDSNGIRMLGALSLLDAGRDVKKINAVYVWGLNFAIRRQAFKVCGGFHPDCIPKRLQRYQGDGETGLSRKITAKGFCAVYHPGVSLEHIIPKSRLTIRAFEERGFYQGVCDSYSQIRSEGIPSLIPCNSWKDTFRPGKIALERVLIARNPTPVGIHRLYERARIAGIKFHQNEVRNDPRLLEWVLKQDYFDYELPPGWKRYDNVYAARRRHGFETLRASP